MVLFIVIRFKGYMNFFTGMFLQVLQAEDPEKGFLRSLFLILYFQSLESMIQFLFKSCEGNETWLKKLTEVSNYSKFNVFGWDTVKIGIIRAKFQFSVWI